MQVELTMAGFTKGLQFKFTLKYKNLSVAESVFSKRKILSVVGLEFTKQKLKYKYLSLHLSLGQHTTTLQCTLNF